MKQTVYVIVDEEGQFFSSISFDCVFWTPLPMYEKLFQNKIQAERIRIKEESRIVEMTMSVGL